MTSSFKDYYEASRDMEFDPLVRYLRLEMTRVEASLSNAEEKYRRRMEAAANEIVTSVLAQKDSVMLDGVHAIYYGPRRSTSWKAVAETFNPPQSLIEQHSTSSAPHVEIKIVGPMPE